ncbi:response regulator [bacterium]|nr:response regulator [bacterium]
MENSIALVIELDRNMADIIKSTLEFYGLEVLYIPDPEEVERIVKTYDIKIIIADIMIPHIPVLSIMVKIRQEQNIPLIITGIKELCNEERKQLLYYAIPFLQKPFSPMTLIESVREMIK